MYLDVREPSLSPLYLSAGPTIFLAPGSYTLTTTLTETDVSPGFAVYSAAYVKRRCISLIHSCIRCFLDRSIRRLSAINVSFRMAAFDLCFRRRQRRPTSRPVKANLWMALPYKSQNADSASRKLRKRSAATVCRLEISDRSC